MYFRLATRPQCAYLGRELVGTGSYYLNLNAVRLLGDCELLAGVQTTRLPRLDAGGRGPGVDKVEFGEQGSNCHTGMHVQYATPACM